MSQRQRKRGRSGGSKAGSPASGKAGRHIAATAATTPAAAPATIASTIREPLTRIRAIDALLGAAICMMIVYHAAFDLNWFHIISADFNHDRFWLSFRDLIVSSFLLLVGASFALGWRAIRVFARTGQTDLELIGRGVLVGICGMLAASVFLSAEYEKQLWLLLGFSAALAALADASARRAAA